MDVSYKYGSLYSAEFVESLKESLTRMVLQLTYHSVLGQNYNEYRNIIYEIIL